MRALIRASLKPSSIFNRLWANRTEYDKEIIKLFIDMGYRPQSPEKNNSASRDQNDKEDANNQNEKINEASKELEKAKTEEGDPADQVIRFFAENAQHLLENSSEAKELFEDVPTDIKKEEIKHLIMLGYTSKGQSKFLVCAINPTELHIRTRQGLFNRLRLSSTEISQKIRAQRRRRRIRAPFKLIGLFKNDWTNAYLKLDNIIEVMEPHRDHPTILGQIIQNPFKELYRNDKPEIIIALITFIIAVTGFFKTPTIAPHVQQFLANQGYNYDVTYVQGALERIYSAFLVTAFIAVVSLILKLFDIWRDKPIAWNSGIKAEKHQSK